MKFNMSYNDLDRKYLIKFMNIIWFGNTPHFKTLDLIIAFPESGEDRERTLLLTGCIRNTSFSIHYITYKYKLNHIFLRIETNNSGAFMCCNSTKLLV